MKFNGHNVRISPKAKLGSNVRVGDNTIIYDNVVIGDGCTISNDCVIGEPTSQYYSDSNYSNIPTVIGKNALVRSHCIIYAGISIGEELETGHRVIMREGTIVGNKCKIGTNCDLQGLLKIGNHCQLHSNVHLCQYCELGDYVFVYPNVVLANDKHPPTEIVKGPLIGHFTQIGIQSSIIGAICIGENCVIGAGATVLKNFPDFSLIIGAPANIKCDVRELTDETGAVLYPWKERFSRGMPWEV